MRVKISVTTVQGANFETEPSDDATSDQVMEVHQLVGDILRGDSGQISIGPTNGETVYVPLHQIHYVRVSEVES